MRRPVYIFALDGTLMADNGAAQRSVVSLARTLYAAGNELWVFCGLVEGKPGQINDWLKTNGIACVDRVRCRLPDETHSPDQIKRNWLYSLPPAERKRIRAAFDSCLMSSDMWRQEGVMCFRPS